MVSRAKAQKAAIDEKLGQQIPLDLTFIDEKGGNLCIMMYYGAQTY